MSAIKFHNISKRYIIHHQRSRSLQELMINLFKREKVISSEEFWALREVDFRVNAGDTLGIIGANGSGKSTALKLLARIIYPTTGQVVINGKVAALLELGTGFHPDLTGRENVYLNGSIVGLSKKTIRHRFDEIVDFAELEQFIDVPVRNYSSGMLMRLGFAVATHIDADILLIDEVLAVGDQVFQSKCYDHITKLRKAGVTILFVSHDLGTVQSLCDKAIWLNQGIIAASGDTESVVNAYQAWSWQRKEDQLDKPPTLEQRWGSGEVEITQVTLCNRTGTPTQTFVPGEPFHVRLRYTTHKPIEHPAFGISIFTQSGENITSPNSVWSGYEIDVIQGEGEAQYSLESLPLQPGSYQLTCAIYDHRIVHPYDHHHRMYTFDVHPPKTGRMDGLVFLTHTWEHVPTPLQRCTPEQS